MTEKEIDKIKKDIEEVKLNLNKTYNHLQLMKNNVQLLIDNSIEKTAKAFQHMCELEEYIKMCNEKECCCNEADEEKKI